MGARSSELLHRVWSGCRFLEELWRRFLFRMAASPVSLFEEIGWSMFGQYAIPTFSECPGRELPARRPN